jgi:hypothetical protein
MKIFKIHAHNDNIFDFCWKIMCWWMFLVHLYFKNYLSISQNKITEYTLSVSFYTKLISPKNHRRMIDMNPYWFQIDAKLLFIAVPLPCIVSEWTKWSAPDATGTRYRVRYMLRPALNGGKECPDLIQLGKGKHNICYQLIDT